MKKILFLVVTIMMILAVQNVFAQDIVFSTDGFSITRLEDGRYAGSDGLEYFLFQSEFDLDTNPSRAWDNCPTKSGGGISASVCTDRVTSTQLNVKVKVLTFPAGVTNVYAYPCYVIAYTNNIQGCDDNNLGYYPAESGISSFFVPNSNGYAGAFRGAYTYGKKIK